MDLTSQDHARRKASKCVAWLMGEPEFAQLMPVTDAAGRKPMVSAFEHDSLRLVTQLARQVGGRTNLVVFSRDHATGDLRLVIASLHTDIATGDGDWDPPVGPACTVGDLFRMLAPGASVTFRLADDEIEIVNLLDTPAPESAAELVDL